jgi:hypothetical protein
MMEIVCGNPGCESAVCCDILLKLSAQVNAGHVVRDPQTVLFVCFAGIVNHRQEF